MFLLHTVHSYLKKIIFMRTIDLHTFHSSLSTKILETYACTSDFVVRIACLGPKLAHVTWSRCEDVTTCGCSKTIVKKQATSGKFLKSLLLSNCATDPGLDFFVYLSVMYFTSYRAFSSFHQHNFVSLSLSFCADVTGFVTEKTYGTRETKGGKKH